MRTKAHRVDGRSLVFGSLFIAYASILIAQAQAPQTDSDVVKVATEVYTEPKLIAAKSAKPNYPPSVRSAEKDGWVTVQMMVDPQGKPYELEVIATSGVKALEEATLAALQKWQFTPATLGGRPVDASIVIPMQFNIADGFAVRTAVERSVQQFSVAFRSDDKSGAEAAMKKVSPQNYYERAQLAMTKYFYATKWGTESQQLEHLREAIGGDTKPTYLSKSAFNGALAALFPLEVKAQDYGAALATWNTLKTQQADPAVIARLQPLADRVEALRKDSRSYTVAGTMPTGMWLHQLFRNKFRIKVVSGHISQIKLYCQAKYVIFPFDETLEYAIDDRYGTCSMIAYGDAETSLLLIQ